MSRDRMVSPAMMSGGRRSAVPAALLSGLLALTWCAAGEEASGPRDTLAAVSSAESGPQKDADQGDEIQDATLEADDTPVEAAAGLGPLLEEEISTLLLEEDEFPFDPDSFLEESGVDYFHEHIGVVGDTYVSGFGEDECARQMDEINEYLVGDDPQDGVIRQALRDRPAGEARVYLWMLSFTNPVDSAQIWDEVLDACEGRRLEDGADTIDFDAFSAGGFRGLTMEMGVESDGSTVEMEGFSATRDLGSNLLMISAVNVDAATFDEVVEAQSAKIDARLGTG